MIERVSHMMSKSQNHQWKWNSTSGMPCHWRTSSRNWLGGCTIWIVKFILRWNFTLCGWRLMSATWRDAKVSWDSSKKNRTVSCISISKGLWSSRWVCSKSANIDFREKSGNASSVTGSLGGKKLVGRQKKLRKKWHELGELTCRNALNNMLKIHVRASCVMYTSSTCWHVNVKRGLSDICHWVSLQVLIQNRFGRTSWRDSTHYIENHCGHSTKCHYNRFLHLEFYHVPSEYSYVLWTAAAVSHMMSKSQLAHSLTPQHLFAIGVLVDAGRRAHTLCLG